MYPVTTYAILAMNNKNNTGVYSYKLKNYSDRGNIVVESDLIKKALKENKIFIRNLILDRDGSLMELNDMPHIRYKVPDTETIEAYYIRKNEPEKIKEFNYHNGVIEASDVSIANVKDTYKFKCPWCGKYHEITPYQMAHSKNWCLNNPRVRDRGMNLEEFSNEHPGLDLPRIWDEKRNGPMKDYFSRSGIRVTFIDPNGFERYVTCVANKTYHKTKPHSAAPGSTSFDEQILNYWFIEQLFKKDKALCDEYGYYTRTTLYGIENDSRVKKNFDFIVEKMNLIVEVQASSHNTLDQQLRDEEGKELARSLGFRLLEVVDGKKVKNKENGKNCLVYHDQQQMISLVSNWLKENYDIDTSTEISDWVRSRAKEVMI